MTRSFLYWSALACCGALTCSTCFGQNPAPSTSQSSSPAPAASPASPQDGTAPAPADAKKPKKVWTNEDVNGLNGPVSVVGNSKNLGKGGPESKADGQYMANARKELAKLQSQLDDTDKQLADLKDFSEGKTPATSGGYEINKGYNRVPVDQQITNLQAKKKQLQEKIGALLDEARKKGVEPGDLR
jgi:peptidoglycan hydrolase CwlO-like protein